MKSSSHDVNKTSAKTENNFNSTTKSIFDLNDDHTLNLFEDVSQISSNNNRLAVHSQFSNTQNTIHELMSFEKSNNRSKERKSSRK